MFCIPKHLVNDFKAKLKSGEISPEKLLDMTSAERRDLFAKVLGESNAHQVNALFESKMLLKSQQQGIINWAKEVAGMKPEVLKDITARVNKMTEVLTPENEAAFLEDLVAHKLGVTVTMQEAGNIASLARDVAAKKEAIAKGGDRLDYGRARADFEDYVNGLKDEAKRKELKDYVKPQNYLEGVSNVAGFLKSMKASLDNSVIGRQGLKTLITQPDIWFKNTIKSFQDIWNTFGGKDVMREVRADILSRENSLNGLYRREKLAVGVREEAYPTSLPEKIPVVGKAFKASETAFSAFQFRTRADVFDRLNANITSAGGDIKGLGELANSLTGRGHLGAFEPGANVWNNLFFSPRFLKSNLDMLTAHVTSKDMSPAVRKEAAINTVKVIGAIGITLAIAKALRPDSVEEDPRSSDFGKIKIGNTRFDITGGMSSLAVLGSRLVTMSSKSSVTGIVSPLNSDTYGAKSGMDVLGSFFEGKLSPITSLVRDVLKGHDFSGKHITVVGEMANLAAPLMITNAIELYQDPKSAPLLLAMIADGLGIGTNTYSAAVDWQSNAGKELQQFHAKVGDEKFKEANKKYNDAYDAWFKRAQADEKYKALSEDEKGKVLSKERMKLKDKIFSEYHFHYKPTKRVLPEIK